MKRFNSQSKKVRTAYLNTKQALRMMGGNMDTNMIYDVVDTFTLNSNS